MHFLYVEDNPMDANLVERYVRQTSHQITIINNIEEAIATLEENFDLILVDVMIEGSRSGYELIKYLRTQGFTQPIIAVTALTLPAEIEYCYQVGCNDILAKPYTIDQLADMVNKYAQH